jgi:plasmid stabilization system protein ParE
MKPLAIEIHPEAVWEAKAAREWYESQSIEAASAFMAELDLGIDCIRNSPEIYPSYLHQTRRYMMHRFPYLIVYRVAATTIQIVAVAHGRRRPGYWKTRSVR